MSKKRYICVIFLFLVPFVIAQSDLGIDDVFDDESGITPPPVPT